jgi:hypothetical protein
MSSKCLPHESLGFSLEQISVQVPCTVRWESMQGSEQVRHCKQCRQQVYNISAMARHDAVEFLQANRSNEGDCQNQRRPCIRFYRRPDGTIIMRDCVTLRQAFRRGTMWIYGLAACLLLIVLNIFGWSRNSDGSTESLWPRICEHEPFRTIFGPRSVTVMGDMVLPLKPGPAEPPPTSLPSDQGGNEIE